MTSSDGDPLTPNHLMIALISLIALVVRLWALGSKGLSYDEGFSLYFSSSPFVSVLPPSQELNPPLYYCVLHVWRLIAGSSEVSLRLPSVLCGVVAVLLTGWIGRMLGGRSLARLSMGLMAIMPMAVEYSQIARSYSLFLALSLASYGCLLRWSRQRQGRWLVAYLLTTILMSAAHHYALFNLLAQQAYLAWQVFRKRVWVRQWISLLLPTLLGILPWMLLAAQQLRSASSAGFWIPKPTLPMLIITPHFYVTRDLDPAFLVVYAALVLLGLLHSAPASAERLWTWREKGFLLLWFACPLVIPFVASFVVTPVFWPRYTIAAVPAFALLIAQGLLHIPHRSGRFLAVCLVLGIAAASTSRSFARTPEAWRSLTATVASLAHQADGITISDRGAQWVFKYYYQGPLPVYPLPASVPPDQQSATHEFLQQIAKAHQRLWMVVFPEPYYHGRQIQELLTTQYPHAKLFYTRAFAGTPGALYLFGYDFRPDAR